MAEQEHDVTNVYFDRRELATMLAALRFWQAHYWVDPRFNAIATDEDQFVALTKDEIDSLCERINV